MKNYYRIMLGKKSSFADEAYRGNFIAAGFIRDHDLTHDLSDTRRDFNKKFIPIWLQTNPGKPKVSAGLACGMLWTVAKGLQLGDVVLCPDGKGSYYVGEVNGGYEYHRGQSLPHRRPVRWFARALTRDEMSDSLKHSAGSIGTVSDLSDHAAELEKLLSGNIPPSIVATDASIEDPSVFALEKHLEEFLVQNW
jgi:restriction system protein